MRVLVRADATLESGTGHVMRCAAFGIRLMAKGAQVRFVSGHLPGSLESWLGEQGFALTALNDAVRHDWRSDLAATQAIADQNGPIDVLVVDHYGLSQPWESGMRDRVKFILTIDDLADRAHDCDLLVDQNLHENPLTRYDGLLPSHAKLLTGPQYAMLRPEFDAVGTVRPRDGSVQRLLVFFGGTDPGNQSLKIIQALRLLGPQAPAATLVLGPAHPAPQQVRQAATGLAGVTILERTNRISTLMAEADLAVGTCGIAAWERCIMSLPSIVAVTAENQREDAEILHGLGAVENLGNADDVAAEDWAAALKRAMEQPERLRTMAQRAYRVMAGRQSAFAQLEQILFDAHA